MRNLGQFGWVLERGSDRTVLTAGGPGSGRYPKGSGKTELAPEVKALVERRSSVAATMAQAMDTRDAAWKKQHEMERAGDKVKAAQAKAQAETAISVWFNASKEHRALTDQLKEMNVDPEDPTKKLVPEGPGYATVRQVLDRPGTFGMDPHLPDWRTTTPTPEQDAQLMALRDVAAGKTVKISTTTHALVSMVQGDRFKTGHEVASRIAYINHHDQGQYMGRRRDYESRAFDGSQPAYGYVAADHGVNIAYGSVTLVLNDKAKNRTTVTFGDSLDNKPPVVWATDLPSMTIASMRKAADPHWGTPSLSGLRYVEAQVHGGLVPSRDIARVVLKAPDAKKMPDTLARLREMGVEVVIQSNTVKRLAAIEELPAIAASGQEK